MEPTYPLGHRSGKTLQQLLDMREACTLRFQHGPDPNNIYEFPGVDSLDPKMAQATHVFLCNAHAMIPDIIKALDDAKKAYAALLSVARDGSRNELEEFIFDLDHENEKP
jgi:hypothetical protein